MGGGKVSPESSGESKDWVYPLINSHMDIVGTLIACCVPCIQHGQICEREGWGSCVMGALLYTGLYCCGCSQATNLLLSLVCSSTANTWRREALRRKHNIKGNIADDILASTACGTCALVQEVHQIIESIASKLLDSFPDAGAALDSISIAAILPTSTAIIRRHKKVIYLKEDVEEVESLLATAFVLKTFNNLDLILDILKVGTANL
ncbi:hypothetical protein HDU97_006546 [Phlyctochytrium planicorne]|nr:hypothetical protein HDU97_006546 [Phlyctochytrium planicorne]